MNKESRVFKTNLSRVFLDAELKRVIDSIPLNGRKCLNLGCGVDGRYADLLSKLDVDGVDILDPGAREQPWRYHICDASDLLFEDEVFDICVAIETFEHIKNNQSAMREVARTLKKEGFVVITTPTIWTWLFEFGRHGPHYYSKQKLIQMVEDSGLKISSLKKCGGFLFYLAGLIKSWMSPFGIRLLGNRWWFVIDGLLSPVYALSYISDRLLSFPPSNWILVAKKSRES